MGTKGQDHLFTLVQISQIQYFLNFFSSITTKPIEAIFHVEPPLHGGTKACSNGLCHMIKMAAMPIYGKNH